MEPPQYTAQKYAAILQWREDIDAVELHDLEARPVAHVDIDRFMTESAEMGMVVDLQANAPKCSAGRGAGERETAQA